MRDSRQRQRLRLLLLRPALGLAGLLLRACAALPRPVRPGQRSVNLRNLRILLIRPDHIGDLLFATPALRVLRGACPDAYLTAMVGPWGRAVVEHNPHLDEIIVCDFPAFSRRPKASLLAPYRLLHQWATRLRSQRFDVAIILRFDHWWGALLAHLAGIPHRLGYAIPECRPFLTQAIPYQDQRHEVQQNLALVEAAAATLCHVLYGAQSAERPLLADPFSLEFTVTPQDQEHVTRYLAQKGVGPDECLIAIHPGAGAAVKLWSPDAWAEVADVIAASWPARFLITGSRDELDLAWAVYARMRSAPSCAAVVAAGDTSLGQLAALFQRCRLVIGPDCGPLHLAVAVGTPTVHLYGPVDAGKFGPWGAPEEHLVITSGRSCIPCNRLDYSVEELPDHPCVREITVQAVLEAAQRLLAKA